MSNGKDNHGQSGIMRLVNKVNSFLGVIDEWRVFSLFIKAKGFLLELFYRKSDTRIKTETLFNPLILLENPGLTLDGTTAYCVT